MQATVLLHQPYLTQRQVTIQLHYAQAPWQIHREIRRYVHRVLQRLVATPPRVIAVEVYYPPTRSARMCCRRIEYHVDGELPTPRLVRTLMLREWSRSAGYQRRYG